MDSIFEKELVRIQINKLFDTYDESTAKQLLIKCVDPNLFKKEEIVDPIKLKEPVLNICAICKSSKFNISNAEEICEQCGSVHKTIFNPQTYRLKQDNSFISKEDRVLKTVIDGKQVTIDIEKMSLYAMSSLTPHQRLYKSGADNIQKILDEYKINYTDDQIKNILSMYWNITLYYDNNKNVKPSIKPTDNKRAYQALCVYYNLELNVYRILEAFDVTMRNLEYFNKILKIIFKGTQYVIKNNIQQSIELKVSNEKINSKTEELMSKLLDAKLFKEVSKETYGATVLYVARDIFKMNYNTVQVQNELSITNPVKLNQNYRRIINFIKQNPKTLY
jgi:hypothetical protein